jgi:hypothetical protein
MSTVTWTDAECRKHGLDTDAEILAGCREVQRLTSEVRKIVEGKGPVPRTKAEIMADIEAAALESVKKTGKVVTKGKAIATYMDTAEGARRYEDYLVAPAEAAKADPSWSSASWGGAPSPSARVAMDEEMKARARQIKHAGESEAQAVSRWLATDEGRRFYGEYTGSPMAKADAPPPLDLKRAIEQNIAAAWNAERGGKLSRERAIADFLNTTRGQALYRQLCHVTDAIGGRG